MSDGLVRLSKDINNSKDLGATERGKRLKPLIERVPMGKKEDARPFCPSGDYRHLLSPETRKRLEERGI